ncbi:MAG: 6-phosphogluconolactonase [Bacteroidota bacterium]
MNGISAFFAQELAQISHSKPDTGYTSLALSGGSTPKSIFEYLSGPGSAKIPWKKIRFFWGDERCVPPDHKESNYRMTKENLFDKTPVPPENIFRIKAEDDPVTEARRYSKLVANYVPAVKNIPIFDIVMLGLGEDGHTASIFPDEIDLFDSSDLFVATRNPYTGQHRISATGKIINNARRVFFLVTGASKAAVVEKIIKKQQNYKELPASRVNTQFHNVSWLLDQEAAVLL